MQSVFSTPDGDTDPAPGDGVKRQIAQKIYREDGVAFMTSGLPNQDDQSIKPRAEYYFITEQTEKISISRCDTPKNTPIFQKYGPYF